MRRGAFDVRAERPDFTVKKIFLKVRDIRPSRVSYGQKEPRSGSEGEYHEETL